MPSCGACLPRSIEDSRAGIAEAERHRLADAAGRAPVTTAMRRAAAAQYISQPPLTLIVAPVM
jgi:hypothetical protein